MSLLDYEKRFSSLKMNARGGQEKSPHKVALLLAVMELIEAKHVQDNQIYFDDRLRDVFTRRFEALASLQDRNNPHLPFFHLRSSGFWHHKVKYGRDRTYDDLTTASGPGAITSNIEYACFDDELFELLGNDVARELLKSALARNLNEQDVAQILDVGNGWNWLECEAIVSDYFVMLDKEVRGETFSKTRHREVLMLKLADRSHGS
ncbi:MAG: hypothetical protein GY814_08800, partial [Gammaproteobacteria bacterium]|nr:hypothetical protein [Gammaproteobacteria bacterium]